MNPMPKMIVSGLLLQLAGDGDRRSIGKSSQVVEKLLASPALVSEFLDALASTDTVLRLRVADVLEKVSVKRADLFQPKAEAILSLAERETQHEVRWHLAQILPRLKLTKAQNARAVAALFNYLQDEKSIIVRTNAMEALFQLAKADKALMNKVRTIIMERSVQGKPAERARARKLLGLK